MKKSIALLMITLLITTLFVGCGAAAATPEQVPDAVSETSGEPSVVDGVVSLRVWAEESNWPVLQTMIDSFVAEYPQQQFDIVLEASNDADTKNNVLSDVHGAADVFPIADDQISALAAGGALYPIANQDAVKAANNAGSVEAATIGDVLYAYPMTADNGYFLYYNKDYFTDADLQTMDGILAVCEANGKLITMDWGSGWYLYSFFGNCGFDFGINDDGVTNHCNWNAADTPIKGVDVANAMLRIAASSGFKNGGDDALAAGANDGSVIAGVSGCWKFTEMKAAWGDSVGACKLPTYTVAGQQVQMASFKGYKYMGVNAYSKNPQWAAKLAEWLTNEQNQNLRFEMAQLGPSNLNAASSDAITLVPSISAVTTQAEYGVLQRVGNSYWDPMSVYGNKMANHNATGEDLQELMDRMVAGITASVAQ